jgi:hypothetical protein
MSKSKSKLVKKEQLLHPDELKLIMELLEEKLDITPSEGISPSASSPESRERLMERTLEKIESINGYWAGLEEFRKLTIRKEKKYSAIVREANSRLPIPLI